MTETLCNGSKTIKVHFKVLQQKKIKVLKDDITKEKYYSADHHRCLTFIIMLIPKEIIQKKRIRAKNRSLSQTIEKSCINVRFRGKHLKRKE